MRLRSKGGNESSAQKSDGKQENMEPVVWTLHKIPGGYSFNKNGSQVPAGTPNVVTQFSSNLGKRPQGLYTQGGQQTNVEP